MGPLYEAIEGDILLAGYSPDGDSVRFMPREPTRLAALRHSSLIRRSSTDGSVQIRLEGIDAPELHYQAVAQPRGGGARDAFLDWLGVTGVRYAFDGTTIVSASATRVPAMILANGVDRRGRPIAYLLREPPRTRTRTQHLPRRRRVSTALLRCTANCAMLEAGHAYLLAYTSLPPAHRHTLRALARAARRKRLGVWKADATARGFALHGGARSVGPEGALVYPKLFRRCIDYLARRHAYGFSGSFADWLGGHGSGGTASPDRVTVRHAANIPFASLVREHDDRIALVADLNDLVFVES